MLGMNTSVKGQPYGLLLLEAAKHMTEEEILTVVDKLSRDFHHSAHAILKSCQRITPTVARALHPKVLH